MSKRILFLDNDTAYVKPYQEVLEDEGYQVKVAESVTEAEQYLKTENYDLLILDVMVPPMSDQELIQYSPQETKLGLTTGLLFYKLNKERLEKNGIRVLVMTIRLDKYIMDEFIKAGLPIASYATKYAMSDPDEFLGNVRRILAEPERLDG
jgi:DNA-binding response OmpR family regulator